MASLSPACGHNTSVPAGQYCPHHLTGGEDFVRVSFDLRVCIDAYLAALERRADTEDMGEGTGVATGVCMLTDDLVAGCPGGSI